MLHPTLDQLSGSLLGLALGDALGAPVEAAPPAEARRYVERVLRAGETPARGPAGYRFGQVTDDTQLARELLLSIGAGWEFQPEEFGRRLINLVASGRMVGGGPASNAAARHLAMGMPWHEAGLPAPYAGNGAAIRSGPLGLIYGHQPRRLANVVADQSRVTHQDPRVAAGALAIAGAAAIAARGAPIDPAEFLVELSSLVEPLDPATGTTVWDLISWVHLPPDEAAGYLADHGIEPEAAHGWHGVSSYVTSSVCWSLYAFLQSPDDWWEAVLLSIAVGGDTDSLAAMTGSIAGARLGAAALPAPLLLTLVDHGAPVQRELAGLAARLHRGVPEE